MAGEYEHIKGKGKQFSSTYQPENRGRKKSVYNELIEKVKAEEGICLSREDCYKLCATLINLPISKLKELAKDETSAAWVVSIISAILTDIKLGRTVTVDSLFDRFFGKATQPTDNKNEHIVRAKDLTPEEAMKYLKQLNEIY